VILGSLFKHSSNDVPKEFNLPITSDMSLLIKSKASGMAPTVASPFSRRYSKIIKAAVKLFITFIGIPTPGGTDVGIGSCLIIVTPVFNVEIIVSVEDAILFKVFIFP
jgi:hypothetical protein